MTDPGRGEWSDFGEGAASAGLAPSLPAPIEGAASANPDTVDPAPTKPPRAHTAALGWMALGIAVLFAIADVVAIVLAVDRSWTTSTMIAQASNLGTAIAFLAGLFALRHKPGRRLGIAAMVLALVANPFILTHLLAFLSGS